VRCAQIPATPRIARAACRFFMTLQKKRHIGAVFQQLRGPLLQFLVNLRLLWN
jgi:hypothetical protein